ncbi:D-alanyl-D-alanine carboxypeptidase/D-alanyl-D-alanine endopeptidase [Actinomadura algeriensis]|uniref:D-alanyl-D-alanine carboxypeptidase/D-alanyl-D-alanine-endopeptidase (Penicillin-binding protein 4) n=1 Tax=Actinomadura algeriensis TaxID=1679523 RepID=A0ABR9JR75_9ACTN|nr:D-alanyl-D-alanine carboxypeptidase/D-alanyl-D-alanine-endopeptidase [Actinomadura algeriensis]MBE1532919.1 D-alanyl-D-alanine carboxypeptidase/D-alanyl-D-alanine-endopeptidase (penicillin-binding protein 4) [Actinomadura algeriensis]
MAARDIVRAAAEVPVAEPGTGPMPDASVLARRLSGAIGGSGTEISAVVVDVATGRALFRHRGDRPATPASTTKLATSVAALASAGPRHRITTRVVRGDGGGIVLVGGGDPTLTALPASPEGDSPRFASLIDLARQTAAALKKTGVGQVRVDYDVSAYQGPGPAPTWKPNYIPDGEVAPVSALTVDKGKVAPQDPTKRARVSDPAAVAAAKFAKLLTDNGVAAKAGRKTVSADGAEQLAAVQSPPLSVLVEYLLTESDNDVAEAVARQVAIDKGLPASFQGAAQAVQQVLTELGVGQGVLVNDGSGLSPKNRITPVALAKIVSLAADADHPDLRSTITGMPVAGFSGTLGPPRYTGQASRAGAGVVRAKTGTLSGVSTLAGIVRDADGRLLAFAFMLGDGKGWVNPLTLDRLASEVARCGC